MIRESIEVTADSVSDARKKAMALLEITDAGELQFEVLDQGSGTDTFSVLRRPARVVARRADEGFGHVERELPESIPAPPPPPGAAPLRRIGLSPGGLRSRPARKPDVIITESTPPPRVDKSGIAPSRAREREKYVASEEHNAKVREVVEEFFAATDLDPEIRYEHGDFQRIFIEVGDREAGALIGRRGSGVDAMEHILSRMICQRCQSNVPVQVDVNQYREREHEMLRERAIAEAERALSSDREFHFEPMSPRDRRVVHLAVQGVGGLTTYTVGEGSRRHVVIVRGDDNAE